MTIPSVTPTGDDVFTAFGYFISQVMNAEAFQGQPNRVPQPKAADFVVMTEIRRDRLSTNGIQYLDCVFTASIAGAVMTVTEVQAGTILIGATVFGVDVPPGAAVESQLSGSVGGTGTYALTAGGTLGSSVLSAGEITITGQFAVTMQVDIYGPNSASNAAVFSTLFRDPKGIAIFYDSGMAVVPLHADTARQMPFIDAEKQFETRYQIEALAQVNEIVSGLSEQYAAELEIEVISVEERFPPA